MSGLLDRLRGGLIVSVQAWAGSAIDDPHVLAAMARAAQENGAVGVRMAGAANIRAARARIDLPILGIVKRAYDGFEPYITPTLVEVREVLDAGAQIVAFDATERPRPGGVTAAELVEAIHEANALAMADCATKADGVSAQAIGADIVATTLCGYTTATRGTPLPALELVHAFAELDAFVICEGGIHTPASARAALDAGAQATVVGTAITNTDWLVSQFASALRPT